jgi:hypothetical protein
MVISIAKRYGWLVHHDLPAQNTRGRWMTNVQGDVGFPDLFMVHPFQGGRPLGDRTKSRKRQGNAWAKDLVKCLRVSRMSCSCVEAQRHGIHPLHVEQSKSVNNRLVACVCLGRMRWAVNRGTWVDRCAPNHARRNETGKASRRAVNIIGCVSAKGTKLGNLVGGAFTHISAIG